MPEQSLIEKVKKFPKSPGVYLMKNTAGTVIYIGKAKSLRSRVNSYFSGQDERRKVHFLKQELSEIEIVVTENERQALVLEADLIKKYKPHYNARLKDDKAHLIVRIDKRKEWPRLELVRQSREDGATYIGPFPFSYELRALVEVIKRTLPLRTCTDRMMMNRVRPCLEYQIKRCAGPCCYEVEKDDYNSWLEQAIQILEGKNKEVVSKLESSMEKASRELRYEDAAVIRDRIRVLQNIVQNKPSVEISSGSQDAFGVYREGSRLEIAVLQVRQGRLFEGKSFSFAEIELETEEVLGSLISQFYDSNSDLPETILLPFELEDFEAREELYSERRGASLKILVPKRGPKAKLMSLAEKNASDNFLSKSDDGEFSDKVLKELKETFSLDEIPRTIECVDVSHFQGSATVASVICFKDAQPEKSRYKKFKLPYLDKPDDFLSMRDVVRRHLSRAAEEDTICDLMLIDGGKGQLSQAIGIRDELGLSRPVMLSLAKKREERKTHRNYRERLESIPVKKPERVFAEGESIPVILKQDSDLLFLFERLRDEAHRFAISFHRQLRTKGAFKSELEKVPGIGPKRRMELLREFGSVKAIKSTSAEEISKRTGIPISLAERMLFLLKK